MKKVKFLWFLLGSIGDKFYIILRGTVSVLVPGRKKSSDEGEDAEGDDEFNFCPEEVRQKIEGLFEFIALNDGKSFGEMALMNNRPRGATILCKEDTFFAVMGREDFQNTLMKVEERLQKGYIEFLSNLVVWLIL